MKKEQILVILSGSPNCGKTTMLKKVVLSFCRQTDCEHTCFTFLFKNKKIGIALDGDDQNTIEENLKYLLEKERCDLVITPCRTKGGTLTAVNFSIQKNKIEQVYFISKVRLEKLSSNITEEEFDKFNQMESEYFTCFIKSLIQ